ncbi:MAG TPA: hypothetical protein DCX46_13180 [Bacteroidetes bacterium]|nr:hypothetical protein [Bacteroidota bacterium]
MLKVWHFTTPPRTLTIMKFSSRTILLLLGLMLVGLAGLVYVQYSLLRDAFTLREQNFRQGVFTSFTQLNERLMGHSAMTGLFNVGADSLPPQTGRQPRNRLMVVNAEVRDDFVRYWVPTDGKRSSGNSVGAYGATSLEDSVFRYRLEKPNKVTIRMYDLTGKLDSVLVQTFRDRGDYALPLPRQRTTGTGYYIQFTTDSMSSVVRKEEGKPERWFVSSGTPDQRYGMITKVFAGLADKPVPPFEQRFSAAFVDSVLGETFRSNGIELPYEFAVSASLASPPVMQRTSASVEAVRMSEYSVLLLPGEIFVPRRTLHVRFPGSSSHLMLLVLPEFAASALFTVIIIACFAAALITIRRQKALGIRLTDFINTMTHEFKTPLSTISLAAEAIERLQSGRPRSRVRRYAGIIRDEYERMRQRVEKILQIAALEEGNVDLRKDIVDVRRLIADAVKSVALRTEDRGGRITVHAESSPDRIVGDRLHLENILLNLLDNALKYSSTTPIIDVRSFALKDTWVVEVADNGNGIAPEHLHRVFEKYYRGPSHSDQEHQGFGLGLSYVKLVAEAHGGSVAVESIPGKGTTFRVTLPQSERGTA